jgi:hypothetical protein
MAFDTCPHERCERELAELRQRNQAIEERAARFMAESGKAPSEETEASPTRP